MKEENGAQLHQMVCTLWQTQLYLMVGIQLLLFWLNFQASSFLPITGTLMKTTGRSFSCLHVVADALPNMATTM
jgi:hypothetical protein